MPKATSKKATKAKPVTRFSFILPAAKKTQPARRSSPATSTSSRPATPPEQGSVAPPRHAHWRPAVPPAERSRNSTPPLSTGNEEEELIERAVGELQQIPKKHKRPAVTETSSSIHVFLLASRGIRSASMAARILSSSTGAMQKEEKDDLLRISHNAQGVAAYSSLAYVIPGLDAFLKAIHYDLADKAFKLEHMYREILQFLHLDDENSDPWVIDTLRWSNAQAADAVR
ncbi:hypothetical protein EV121DRAFT_296990 [Schizophyllum commune]